MGESSRKKPVARAAAPAPTAPETADRGSASDVVVIHGVTEDGQGLEVLRARQQRLELGQLRRLEQGKPVHGDIVKLRPRQGMPLVCDVETEVSLPPPRAGRAETSKGPAQVASRAYRQNWEAIWNRPLGDEDERPN